MKATKKMTSFIIIMVVFLAAAAPILQQGTIRKRLKKYWSFIIRRRERPNGWQILSQRK